MSSRYREVYQSWKSDPEGFWAEAARDIDWFRPWDRVFDAEAGVYGRWFAGAECNTCHNAVDRHVAGGRAAQPALIYDSPITGRQKTFTYAELLAEVTALAAVLQDQGVGKGDRVIIYMPMVPEAVFAMLACARLGAIHSVVFGGFAAKELATRIDDATPKLIVSASCGVEPGRVIAYKPLLDGAIGMARHKPERCIVLQRDEQPCELIAGRDIDYAQSVAAVKASGREVACVPVKATDPLYILYTSGTTGQPKGVVRDNGGHMVMLKWSMENEFGVKPGEVFWAASDVGWVVGHSYIVYAPLFHGCTTILFEGKPIGTPDAGTFWRVISEHGAVACSPRRPPFAPSARKTRTAASSRATTSRNSAPCSSPASAPTPKPSNGPSSGWIVRSSTIGGRPRPVRRSATIRSGSAACRSNTARPASPCRAMTCRCWTMQAIACRPERSAMW